MANDKSLAVMITDTYMKQGGKKEGSYTTIQYRLSITFTSSRILRRKQAYVN